MQLLQVKLNLSTAFHPESNGQTERVNHSLEQYLRSYCSYQQDDWVSLLPLAEHAFNTSMSESRKASPIEINYGFSPPTQWSGIVSENKEQYPDSKLVVKDWEGTWQEIRETIQQAQERQPKWHDQKRQPAPEYVTLEDVIQGRAKKADRVMLNRKNLRSKRPMEKLAYRMFEPFLVKRKVGSRAYEIELPERWDIHPICYVSLYESYREDSVCRPQKIITRPDIEDNKPGNIVAEVVDSRCYGNPKSKFPHRLVKYMVAWEVYGPEENSGKPFQMLEYPAMQALQQFHETYPSKPKDHRVIDNPNLGTKRRR